MPRFVLLHHELPADSGRDSHWDLMLEQGDVLRTWALAQELQLGIEIACEALRDHRIAYLDYEGPVGGNRGSVTRVDAGDYTLLSETADQIDVHLSGQLYVGQLRLKRTAQSWVARFFLPESEA